MIHCLDDGGNPISILDLCGLSLDEAEAELRNLYIEMNANPKKWKYQDGEPLQPGVRVIIEWFKERGPLEHPGDPGFHPKFGLQLCWFWSISDPGGPHAAYRRIMYVVRPSKELKPFKAPVPLVKPRNGYEALLQATPIVGSIMDIVALIRFDAEQRKREAT